MSILIYAIVVLLLACLAVYVLRMASPDPNVTNIGSIVILIVAVLVIAAQAGVV